MPSIRRNQYLISIALIGTMGVPLRAQTGPVQLSTTTWTALGPAPLNGFVGAQGGRVEGIAVDPTNDNTMYIAAANGGVWKTTDGGVNWIPLTDNQPTLAMGSI